MPLLHISANETHEIRPSNSRIITSLKFSAESVQNGILRHLNPR